MLCYSFNEMYDSAKNCDSSYDGKFFVAVKTTKIFCIPSCKAKFPLPKNLEFFETKEEAIKAGYRGCKRCYSANWPINDPPWLEPVVSYIKNNTKTKVELTQLTTLANVDATTLRRYFKKRYNQSLMDYQRSIRLDKAKELLNHNPIPVVARICGFSTIKGFKLAYYKKFAEYPNSKKSIEPLDENYEGNNIQKY